MRALIGILVAIGLVVLVLVLIFSGGGGPTKKPLYLPDYATSTSFAQMSIRGPINAPQDHNDVRVTVSSSDSSLEIIKGYEDQTASTKTFDMTPAAYTQFLFALQRENFTKGNPDSSLKENRGICPFGRLYTFVFNDGSNERERYWTTSCGQGNFQGNGIAVRDLFQAQIPDYSTLTTDVNL
ncbi:MAG TPA: hypothetical protein VHD60_01440 [Candidatus Saccharimonadales bacterium]|nr:hypothetical protein [Candidatus Saccharimonadales bacterium]